MDSKLLQYEGREQSFIKHQFLTRYLQSAAYKTMQGRSPVFNFVDAFAGPWRVEDEYDFSDASFDQALKTLSDVRTDLLDKGLAEPRIRFCFCEKRLKAAKQLLRYAQQKTDFEIHVFPGTFEDNLDAISAVLKGGFTFTFIDPTGWDIRNDDVFRFLKKQKGEFLLNFMSDHINRHSGYEAVSASFGRFLADPDWAEQFRSLSDELSNEAKVLQILKSKMKDAQIAKFLPDLSIRVPRQERTKMRLILGTHSKQGLELFRDVQAKVEEQEFEIRHNLKHEDDPQGSLFSTAQHLQFEAQEKGVGCYENQLKAEAMICELLKSSPICEYDKICSEVMEAIAIRRPQINTLIKDMKKRGLVSYTLAKRKRVPAAETIISAAPPP